MASNFIVIPIRLLLTVDSEMAFFLFHSLAEGVLGRFPFTKNSRKFRWKFPSGEKRIPFNSGPFAAQWLRFYAPKFKNVAVNSLEVVRPFKSCKWNTHFHRKVSNGKTGLPFQKFRLFRKFSSGTNQKRVFHLHPNRNFRNFLVNGILLKLMRCKKNSLPTGEFQSKPMSYSSPRVSCDTGFKRKIYLGIH